MDMENLIGETTEYDKKAALEVKKPKSWCKSVSAFAKTLGDGTLEAFVRIENESVKASATELKRLVLRGRNTSYDSQVTPYRVEDCAFSKLRERYKKWTGNSFDNKDLVSFGLDKSGDTMTALDDAEYSGSVPDGSMIQDRDPLTEPSTQRNPVLADVFNRLGYMERKGRGFSGHWEVENQ